MKERNKTIRMINKINTNNIHTPKDLDKAFLQIAAKRVGFEKIDRMIEELKAKNTFSHKEYYSRMKRKYRNLINT